MPLLIAKHENKQNYTFIYLNWCFLNLTFKLEAITSIIDKKKATKFICFLMQIEFNNQKRRKKSLVCLFYLQFVTCFINLFKKKIQLNKLHKFIDPYCMHV